MEQEPSIVKAAVTQQWEDGTITFDIRIADAHLTQPLSVKMSVWRGNVVLTSTQVDISREDAVVKREGLMKVEYAGSTREGSPFYRLTLDDPEHLPERRVYDILFSPDKKDIETIGKAGWVKALGEDDE